MYETPGIMKNIIFGVLYMYLFVFFKFSLNKNGLNYILNLALFYSLLFSLTNVL